MLTTTSRCDLEALKLSMLFSFLRQALSAWPCARHMCESVQHQIVWPHRRHGINFALSACTYQLAL